MRSCGRTTITRARIGRQQAGAAGRLVGGRTRPLADILHHGQGPDMAETVAAEMPSRAAIDACALAAGSRIACLQR